MDTEINVNWDRHKDNENSFDNELCHTHDMSSRRRKSFVELYAETKKNRKSSKAQRDRVEGMIQALRFDPFWQRDEVILSDLSIKNK